MRLKIKTIILLLHFLVSAEVGTAQNKLHDWLFPQIDSTYIEDYKNDFIFRLYTSQKYSRQNIVDSGENTALSYRPSNGFTLGAGVNYKFLALNIGLVFPFTTPDQSKYGKTNHLDLQAHLYLPRFTFDFFSGYYKGQYLINTNDFVSEIESQNYYKRKDIRTYSLGFGLYANFNPRKYSFKAAFTQNERQKKSAGQPIAGLEAYWVGSRADNSMIPTFVGNDKFFEGVNFDRWGFFTVNLTAGYAYTFVILKRFFLLGGLNGSAGIGTNRLYPVNASHLDNTSINFSLNERLGVGYQFDRIFVGVSWVDFHLISPTAIDNTYVNWNAGNMRFNVAYRIRSKKDLEIRPWKWFKSGSL